MRDVVPCQVVNDEVRYTIIVCGYAYSSLNYHWYACSIQYVAEFVNLSYSYAFSS